MSETQEPEIVFERRGALALATLNRPKALNTLTRGMMHAYHPRLADWVGNPGVSAVVIRATGSRAFCAGGDVLRIWEAIREGSEMPVVFFREEYALNHDIHGFPKPYIAFLDGIVMGGGVGLSVHGSHRIVTENTAFAMPETGIGLFPDVGGTYFLTRLEGELGMFLGLTGQRLKAADCLYSGVGTHHVESARLDDLIAALAEAEVATPAEVDAVLADFTSDPGPALLAGRRAAIDRCFAGDSVEAILAALEAEGTPWAEELLVRLGRCSPTSLKLTFRQLRQGRGLSFAQAMTIEYRLSQACMFGHDFPEGVRALLIDKDRNPVWEYGASRDVPAEVLAGFFAEPWDSNPLADL